MLRFAENPRDEVAGFRTLQLLPGIGPKTARQALQAVAEAETPLSQLATCDVPSKVRPAWNELALLLRQLSDPSTPWVGQFGLIRAWYEPYLDELYEAGVARNADLEELEVIAGTFESRERFLCDITLDPPDVAMTRAKSELHLIHPQRFYTHRQARRGDRHVYAPRSRFVPCEVLQYFDQGPACSNYIPHAAALVPPKSVTIDIAAELRDMWG